MCSGTWKNSGLSSRDRGCGFTNSGSRRYPGEKALNMSITTILFSLINNLA